MYKQSILFLMLLAFLSCQDNAVPKPKAYLRLDYPEVKYNEAKVEPLPFAFKISDQVSSVKLKNIASTTKSYGVNIEYKQLKGTIFLTYKAIDGNKENLKYFLKDAEKFTEKHMVKADEIPVYPYQNNARKVYGKHYIVKGNVASQSQFHVTDSVNHFLTGSLYFYAKPNYDSILPAAHYLQKDMQKIMESIVWQ